VNRKVNILPDARADIQALWDYGAREHGVEAANAYVIRLDEVMHRALEFPDMGSDYGDVRAGYRKMISGQHLIFYIPHDGGIDVIRVLHGRMDVRARL
jgi:toxin ParE1/3/4